MQIADQINDDGRQALRRARCQPNEPENDSLLSDK
jgi:hypothetical protein